MNEKIFRFGKNKNRFCGIDSHVNVLDGEFVLHTHDYCEFEYAAEGEGINYINGVGTAVSRGSTWALGRDDDHRLEGRGLKIFSISLYLPELSEAMARLVGGAGLPMSGVISDENIMTRIEQCFGILADLDRSAPYAAEEYSGAAALILGAMLPSMKSAERIGNKTAEYVRFAGRYLREHYSEEVRLSDVAGKLHIAPAYLSGIFSEYAGCTFNEYLVRVRVNRARELLHSTNKTVTEISNMCGFGCVSTMNRAFARYEGRSPTGMRKK